MAIPLVNDAEFGSYTYLVGRPMCTRLGADTDRVMPEVHYDIRNAVHGSLERNEDEPYYCEA